MGAPTGPAHDDATSPGARFRRLLERDEPLVLPGVADALTARLAAGDGIEAACRFATEAAGKFAGLDRFEARKAVVAALQ